MKILVSAGEASGDRYAAELVEELRCRIPEAEFFGCGGQHLRAAGLRAVIRSEDLAVVGIFEVVRHIPRIYGLFRRLVSAAVAERPALAILTDSPDFHLRLAPKLRAAGIPVLYYVAPQVWAWRPGRIRLLRKFVDHLMCIFPFEEDYFRERGVAATFVGHPLAGRLAPLCPRGEFFERHGLDPELETVALLPGSRKGEAARHLAPLADAVARLQQVRPMNFVLPASSTTGRMFFRERIENSIVKIVEGGAQDALGHADLALVASGTATVEAAILGTPMVVFYRVNTMTWSAGKLLVSVPFYSMVNLLAERKVVPELIQTECRGERLAAETLRLLDSGPERERMKAGLRAVSDSLAGPMTAAQRAASIVCGKAAALSAY
jgi:lipid-A-disaccharide synthase